MVVLPWVMAGEFSVRNTVARAFAQRSADAGSQALSRRLDAMAIAEPLLRRLTTMIAADQRCVLIGVGSNIDPEHNVTAAVGELLRRSPWIAVSRVIRTVPIGLEPGAGMFLNVAVAMPCDLDETVLKPDLQRIEVMLGRDMDRPDRAHVSRPIDLDIHGFWTGRQRWTDDGIPSDPWVRSLAVELLTFLEVPCPTPGMPEPGACVGPGVCLGIGDIEFGEAPTIVRRP